jgi:hypothetical protein
LNINKIDINISVCYQLPSALELPSALADGIRSAELLALATYYGAKALFYRSLL